MDQCEPGGRNIETCRALVDKYAKESTCLRSLPDRIAPTILFPLSIHIKMPPAVSHLGALKRDGR